MQQGLPTLMRCKQRQDGDLMCSNTACSFMHIYLYVLRCNPENTVSRDDLQCLAELTPLCIAMPSWHQQQLFFP